MVDEPVDDGPGLGIESGRQNDGARRSSRHTELGVAPGDVVFEGFWRQPPIPGGNTGLVGAFQGNWTPAPEGHDNADSVLARDSRLAIAQASFWRDTPGESPPGLFVMRPSEKEDHDGHARC